MATVQIKTAAGLIELLLAEDPTSGRPMFKRGVQDYLQPSVQVGEPGYANFLPRIGGVYALSDFSGGVGSRFQKPATHKDANRYWFADWVDASSGRAVKGPKLNTLTAPANSGTLTGAFELGGTVYLMLSRKIVSWNSGTDVLTEVRDYTSSFNSSGSVVFSKLGSEASVEASTGTGATADIDSPEDRVAQQIRTDDTSVIFVGRVECDLIRTGTVTGDVRLRICTDINGRPGDVIGSARVLASTVPTSAGTVTFRFDDDEVIPLPYNEPMWLMLDAAGAATATTIQWTRGSSTSYARGAAYLSQDGGNSWSAYSDTDVKFALYAKTPATTAYVGSDSVSKLFATTTNGSAYTDDSYRTSSQFALVGDRLIRDVQTGANGTIAYSDDGVNWSESIPVGDVGVPVTNLIPLGDAVIVCKRDSIWAVDILSESLEIVQLDNGAPSADNGKGAGFFKGAVFVPFGSRLVGITGDFAGGFTVYGDVSPTVLPEWGAPHGAGRVCAVASDRFFLYAILSAATGGYRVYKARNPLKRNSDTDEAAPDWHGSIATVGDGTQTVQFAYVYDPGGTGNPQLFVTKDTSGNVARFKLPRTADPDADANIEYDTDNLGDLYLPDGTLGFTVHPKAWLHEALTFSEPMAAGDYVDVVYTLRDLEGYKRLGRVRDSDVLPYPVGLESRLLGRRVQIKNNATTASPVLQAVGLTGAVRPVGLEGPRNISFVVEAADGLNANSLMTMLMTGRMTQRDALDRATRGGTRTLIGPDGESYRSVLFLDAVDTTLASGEHGVNYIEVTAVQVG